MESLGSPPAPCPQSVRIPLKALKEGGQVTHTPHSQASAMGAGKEQGGLVRTRNNERENWPCRVSFEFPKEIGASQIVPEIEL